MMNKNLICKKCKHIFGIGNWKKYTEEGTSEEDPSFICKKCAEEDGAI